MIPEECKGKRCTKKIKIIIIIMGKILIENQTV